ncbi:hypothetical protein [Streptomyces goshikiensis]|uniref:hypothetical protein n=1 Tax=Streptomyces goshikiensis TaxID=1942 RepID=UPI0036ACE2D1
MEASDARAVYVHGNGNKVREDLLKSQWYSALFGADMGAATRMAYWAPCGVRPRSPMPGRIPLTEGPEGLVPSATGATGDPAEAEAALGDWLVTNDSGNHHGVREYLSTKPVRDPVRAMFAGLATGQTQ